jgi:Iap family predicted aminopeptidase
MSRRWIALVVGGAVAAAAVTVVVLPGGESGGKPSASGGTPARGTQSLPRALTAGGVVAHLRALERIARRSGGNRAAGTPGYRRSVRYVAGRLRAAGWRVRFQPVPFSYFRERSRPLVRRADGRPVRNVGTLRYSGSGDVRGRGVPAGDGCSSDDFGGFPRGEVALLDRGHCFLRVKVLNAQRAGAAAALVTNTEEAAIPGTLIEPDVRIPAVSIGRSAGRELAAERPRLHVRVEADSERRTTTNVIAERGRGGRVAMAGGHLDSVPEGPGIDDDGSGVATLLEIAEQWRPARRVRLAFWGAEELGLIGSRRYVRSLSKTARKAISGYLNLDMVGSGNGGRFLYGGEGLEAAVKAARPAVGEPLERTSIGGASDHAPFDRAGVPVIGLFSGATGRKSERQAREWGGRAGRPFDPCYHRACDTLAHVDRRALSRLGDGAAAILATLAGGR